MHTLWKSVFCLVVSGLWSSFWCESILAQQNSIHVIGSVYDHDRSGSVPNLMIVNKRTQQGYFCDNDGSFAMDVDRNDEFIFAANGFSTIKVCFRDSSQKDTFSVRIVMRKLQVTLNTVEIFTKRDLDEIQKDIETLGFREEDYMLEGLDALQSPITALYQAFSRRERNKRMVAEMRNNDKRRALLKELFRKYVDHDIIQLNNDEFDSFIDFCRVSDEFMKSSTQYEFIIYIKKRFEIYRMLGN